MMMMCLILKYKRIPKVMLLGSEVQEAWKSWEASQERALSLLAFCPERTGTSRVLCLFAANFFLAAPQGMQDLIPQSGIEPVPPKVEGASCSGSVEC